MIEFINEHYDWYCSMTQGLGHHSWWYTNRTPDECINVKLNAWVDLDDVKARLTNSQLELVELLSIGLERMCYDIAWDDCGLVDQAREYLLEELKEDYNVSDTEYGGRSGGWLAVVYNWDDIPSDYEDGYTYQEVKEFYQTIKRASAEHEKVTQLVLERKSQLEQAIEDVDNYIGVIIEEIEYLKESRIDIATKLQAIA